MMHEWCLSWLKQRIYIKKWLKIIYLIKKRQTKRNLEPGSDHLAAWVFMALNFNLYI